MLSSIHPLGERTRGHRWGGTATWYVVGSMLGGAMVGATFGLAGVALEAVASPGETAVLVAATVVLVAAAVFDVTGMPLPSPERQVDETWMNRYRPWVYGGGYGFQLGTGLMTFVKTASVYALWVLVVLAGSLPLGAAVGAWFGLVRGSALLSVVGVTDPTRLRRYFRRMAALAPAARIVGIAGPIAAGALVWGLR